MKRGLFLTICICQLFACVDQNVAPGIDKTQISRESQFLSALSPGQVQMDVLGQVADNITAFFEVRRHHQVYRYAAGRLPGSGVLFGLYFIDQALVALLLGDDVAVFHTCRGLRENVHWTARDFEIYATWLARHNRLGETIALYPPESSEVDGLTASDMWEAASYGPVIAFALGYYTLDQVAGGYQRDQQKRRLLTYMQEAAPQVKLGYTVDEVYAKLGSYDTKLNAGASIALVYQNPSYAFGIKGEQVVWRESPARVKPATPSNAHCKTIGL